MKSATHRMNDSETTWTIRLLLRLDTVYEPSSCVLPCMFSVRVVSIVLSVHVSSRSLSSSSVSLFCILFQRVLKRRMSWRFSFSDQKKSRKAITWRTLASVSLCPNLMQVATNGGPPNLKTLEFWVLGCLSSCPDSDSTKARMKKVLIVRWWESMLQSEPQSHWLISWIFHPKLLKKTRNTWNRFLSFLKSQKHARIPRIPSISFQ